jgi:alanine dehydrogenase
VRGQRAPIVVTRDMLRRLRSRAVVMDFAIDMGGCFETSRPTHFPNPTYEVDGIVHFCVPNVPSCAARSATQALTSALLPYLSELAGRGIDEALGRLADLRNATYLYRGGCVQDTLARVFDVPLLHVPTSQERE